MSTRDVNTIILEKQYACLRLRKLEHVYTLEMLIVVWKSTKYFFPHGAKLLVFSNENLQRVLRDMTFCNCGKKHYFPGIFPDIQKYGLLP